MRVTSSRRSEAVVVVLTLVVLSVGAVGPVSGAPTDAVAVTQDGTCRTVTPLGDGSQTVSEHYDYRAGTGTAYASYGTTDIQQSQVSQLYAYEGSEGVSLVMLHDKFGDEFGGSALRFDITGLPADREWAVEDDDYPNRDDNFDHRATASTIEWKWAPNRTDGAAVRGLGSDDYDAITIDPLFNAGDSYWDWPWADDDVERWIVRSGDGTTYDLNMSKEVHVRAGYCPGDPPNADLVTEGTVGSGNLTVLDASNSTDDGRIVAYRWDLTGDGTTDTTTTSPTVEYTYQTVGTVSPSVTVVDDGGQTDTDTETLTVTDSTPPEAVADVPDEAMEGTVVNMSGSGSFDNDVVESYEWDFGDGDTATGERVSHVYDSDGTYTVTLTVTDGANNTDTATTSITITPDTTPPEATLDAPATVEPGDVATLDASNSTDDGRIVEYRWDVTGDGSVDETTSSAAVDHTYDDLGTYEPTVTVVDTGGNEDTASVTLNVTDATAPTASFTYDPQSPTVGETVSFDATASTDAASGVASYAWDFDDDGTTDATGATATHAFASAGDQEVTLTVTDEAGNAATVTRTVSVEEQQTVTIEEAVAGINAPADEIDLAEIQTAIDWWAEDEPVPGTDGEKIDLAKLQTLIDIWAENRTVG